MIFTRPVRRKVAAGPPPTVPDPDIAWWKFHENDGASSIPNSVGTANNLNIENFAAGDWTTNNGRPAYHFSLDSKRGRTQIPLDYGIGTGDYTMAIRCNPLTFQRAGGTVYPLMSLGGFNPSQVVLNSSGLGADGMQTYAGGWLDYVLGVVPNAVNWFIYRRMSSNCDGFHNGSKGTTRTDSRNYIDNYFQVANNGTTQFADMIADEVRLYSTALTDQQCFDLMLNV